MTKILVTGACGQLGLELRLAVAESPNRFIFTDIVGEGSVGSGCRGGACESVTDGVACGPVDGGGRSDVSGTEGIGKVEYLDITDYEAVMRAVEVYGPEIIVNCAAYTNVERAEEAREEAYKVNCTAVENLAAAAAYCGAVLIHISTDYVFDGRSRKPYKEDDEAAPLNVYGETKMAGERAVATSGCKHLLFRTSWLYSPFGNNFVKTMLRVLREGTEVKVVDDQIGTPTYAADLAALICKVIDDGLWNRTGIYNYSNEGECSWWEFAAAIAELAGPGKAKDVRAEAFADGCANGKSSVSEWHDGGECHIKHCSSKDYPTKALRPEYSVLDKSKVRDVFGIEIPAWRDSLAACLARLERFL